MVSTVRSTIYYVACMLCSTGLKTKPPAPLGVKQYIHPRLHQQDPFSAFI